MTATATATATTDLRTSSASIVRVGLAAAATASLATIAVAATGRAAGISLDVSGEPIPVLGFGVMTAICSALGLLIALVLTRTAAHPQRLFVRITVALTALSLVPDLIADAATPTKALLMLAHLVAAAIVVPALARRLPA